MLEDFVNRRFGHLVVLRDRPDLKNPKTRKRTVECKCDCGNTKTFQLSNLKTGNTTSCGCVWIESVTKHGLRNLPEYKTWLKIANRCYNKNNEYYYRYGGRGITVCDEWKESFETFYKDMGPRPGPEYSIDRKDNDKGYSKDNCRWATDVEQANNTSRNVFYTHNGETLTLAQWCTALRLKYQTVYDRIRYGWNFAEAIQCIESKQITYDAWKDGKPVETMSLKNWCELLRLNKNNVYLRYLRGESFEDIVAE